MTTEPTSAPRPFDVQTQARANLLALAAQPDIAEAIAGAGRVLTFDDLYELDLDP